MRKSAAALGTLIFFLVGPTTTMGVIPWWITGWRMAEPAPYGIGVRSVGAVLIVLGAGVIVHAFVRFVVEGFGTPVPIAPPSHLVVGGPYRYVRNPMYLAVVAVIFGQALLLAQPSLAWFAALLALLFVAFARGYEEPTLSAQFGAEYEEYRRAVPGWLPRLRPWPGHKQAGA
jgi:protein-S-isoprenylcysteine O-methyltransferase Ste14